MAPDRKARPSPTESATDFEEGTIKVGGDGNEYIVALDKNGRHRWAKHKTAEDAKPVKEKKPRATKKVKEPEVERVPTPEPEETSEAEAEPEPVKVKEPEETSEPEPAPAKKKGTRRAPLEPAKNHEDGYEMEGLDGRTFVVRTAKNGVKRWIPYH